MYFNENMSAIKFLKNNMSTTSESEFSTDVIPLLICLDHTTTSKSLDLIVPNPSLDSWDIANLEKKNTNNTILNFSDFPTTERNKVKCFCILRIIKGRKIGTVHEDLVSLRRIYSYLLENNITDVMLISYKQAMKLSNENPKTGTCLVEYLNTLQLITGQTPLIDLKEYDKNRPHSKDSKTNSNHYALIPSAYFKKIMSVTKEVLFDDTKPVNDRLLAGLLRITSQIGLRSSELLNLRTDALSCKMIEGFGLRYYLTFNVYKDKNEDEDNLNTVACNDIAREAFEKMLDIRENNTALSSLPYLYIPSSQKHITYPVKLSGLSSRLKHFFITYMYDETQKDWGEIRKVTVKGFSEKFSIPSIHNFRVNVATELCAKRVNQDLIRQRMSHLDNLVTSIYERPALLTSKDSEYVWDVIKSVTVDDAQLMGPHGKEVAKSIKEFVAANNINIASMPIDDIRKKLSGKLYLSPKDGGLCCIKVGSDKTACSSGTGIARIACAMNTCPNLYRLYYHVPISLNDFRLARDAERDALNLGLRQQAEQEHVKASMAQSHLREELSDLKKQLKQRGSKAILEEHPELEYAIKYIDAISKEIEIWK